MKHSVRPETRLNFHNSFLLSTKIYMYFNSESLISRNDVKSGVKTTTSVTFPLFSTSYDTAENRLGDDTNIGRHILVLGI